MNNKSLLLILSIAASIYGVIDKSQAISAEKPDWMEKSLFALAEEQSIVEVMFQNNRPRSLWISMRDNGGDRSGFAEYACTILHMNGMPVGNNTIIHIWDAAVLAREEMREIGSTTCSRTE